MNVDVSVNKYRFLRHRFYEWQNELDFARKVMLALGFACLTGLLAQMKLFIPGNPIPLTGQVFAVLLAGVVLGSRFGALSQGLYVGLGLAGVPWLAGVSGMFTLGYLVGFVIAAAIIGWAVEKYTETRNFRNLLALMMVGVGIIYVLGALWFGYMTGYGLGTVLAMAVIPFVIGDVVKAIAAASVSRMITTRQVV
ncbi:MAG: biotin transporter BioY [Thermoplasmata archaeon]|nr:biotin transporter BioY [Thermoplasmata archaeon]